MRTILETLYRSLIAKGYPPGLLRLMVTVNYISLGRDLGVKAAIKGKGLTYLREIAKEFDTSDFSFGPVLGWLIYFACLGGRVFRVSAAKQLLRENRLSLQS